MGQESIAGFGDCVRVMVQRGNEKVINQEVSLAENDTVVSTEIEDEEIFKEDEVDVQAC